MAISRQQCLEHLRFYAELGVDGLSRDPAWRVRHDPTAPPPNLRAEEPVADERTAVGASQSPVVEPAPSLFDQGRPQGPPGDPAAALSTIRSDLGDCTRCKLHTLGRSTIVFGVGSPGAQLMFVGEAPGQDEDIQGIPFVGRAGQLLTRMIEAIDLRRDEVYIANVIKCRPPGNRNPEADEVATCEPFLFRQIDVIRPRVIVALGKFAAQALLRSNEPISRLRGRVFDYRGAVLVPTFHPAFLLRSPNYKREAWEDLKKVRALLASR